MLLQLFSVSSYLLCLFPFLVYLSFSSRKEEKYLGKDQVLVHLYERNQSPLFSILAVIRFE